MKNLLLLFAIFSLGETIMPSNEGTEEVELLLIGIAPAKQKQLFNESLQNQAMALQMDFVVWMGSKQHEIVWPAASGLPKN